MSPRPQLKRLTNIVNKQTQKAAFDVLLQYVDINLYIQNEDSKEADTTIGVSIIPELRVEFTPSSFARLLSISGLFSVLLWQWSMHSYVTLFTKIVVLVHQDQSFTAQ